MQRISQFYTGFTVVADCQLDVGNPNHATRVRDSALTHCQDVLFARADPVIIDVCTCGDSGPFPVVNHETHFRNDMTNYSYPSHCTYKQYNISKSKPCMFAAKQKTS